MGDNTVRKVEKGADKLARKSSKSKNFSNKMENLGKLELHLTWDANGTLSVYLGKAKGLPSKDTIGSSDPYAKVYLLQSNPAALFEKGHEQTKSHKNNLNPDFNESFVFKGIDKAMLLNSRLCVSIWDKDVLTADEYMGGVRIQMSHFAYDGSKGGLNIKFWANLQTSYLDGHPLEVSESTLNSYLIPSAFSESMRSKSSVTAGHSSSSSSASSTPSIKKRSVMERRKANLTFKVSFDSNGFLKVYLMRAQDLPDKDLIGKSDPYAKVYLLDDNNKRFLDFNKKQKTKTKKNTQNPEFHEEFQFSMNLQLIRTLRMVVEIWDDDFGKDQFLAGVMFTMASFNLSTEVELTVPLYTGLTNNLPTEVVDVMSFSVRKYTSAPPQRPNANLTFKVSFDSNGFLKVYLMRALNLPDKDLIGKSDPYAKVYLLDDNNKRFLDFNKKQKTKTKKNTQSPEFQEEFQFSMNLQLIRTLRTVIEIWDDDFGKDEFLAGVMFTMASFNLSTEVELTVPLYSGLNSNLPFEVDDVMRFSVQKYSSVPLTRPRSSSSSSSSSSSDDDDDGRNYLRQSNNKLISYIEKARIMAQAYGIGRSIPNSINVEENVNSKARQDIEFDASTSLFPLLNEIKEKIRRAREEEARLRGRNNDLRIQYDERKRTLEEKDRSIWDLESEIAALQGKITVIQAEFVRIREWTESLEREHEYYLVQVKVAQDAITDIPFNNASLEIERQNEALRGSMTEEVKKEIEERVSEVNIPISVYMKFKERMESELEAKRKEYLRSVGKIQLDTEQILAMYDKIVAAKERGSIASYRKTSVIEKMNFYHGDISKIEGEINNLKMELARMQAEFDRKEAEHASQLRLKKSEFEAFRKQFEVDLAAWFKRSGAEFNAWCREQVELAIYSKLIEFEENRLAMMAHQSQTPARVSTSKSRSSYSTGPIVHGGQSRVSTSRSSYSTTTGHEGWARGEEVFHGGDSSARSSITTRGYESRSGWSSSAGAGAGAGAGYNFQKRKESGYHSPGTKTPGNKTPDSTLDRDSRYSDVFDNIKNDMNEMHI